MITSCHDDKIITFTFKSILNSNNSLTNSFTRIKSTDVSASKNVPFAKDGEKNYIISKHSSNIISSRFNSLSWSINGLIDFSSFEMNAQRQRLQYKFYG